MGGDGDEVIRGSKPVTGGSRRTSSKNMDGNINTENVEAVNTTLGTIMKKT